MVRVERGTFVDAPTSLTAEYWKEFGPVYKKKRFLDAPPDGQWLPAPAGGQSRQTIQPTEKRRTEWIGTPWKT